MALVLVVDDEPDIRALVKTSLELSGFDTIAVAGGEAALAAIDAHRPDAVILDVMMPDMDGWEVLSRIKALDGERSETPVLMLTARTDDLDRIRGGIEGALRYLTKPFDLDDLVMEVRKAIEGGAEPARRRRAQHQALEDLARLERGADPSTEPSPAPRPRITRLERAVTAPALAAPTSHRVPAARLALLSPKQRGLLDVVAATGTVTDAAARLAVSRSNVYASLRRIARKLEVASVEQLVRLARAGDVSDPG